MDDDDDDGYLLIPWDPAAVSNFLVEGSCSSLVLAGELVWSRKGVGSDGYVDQLPTRAPITHFFFLRFGTKIWKVML